METRNKEKQDIGVSLKSTTFAADSPSDRPPGQIKTSVTLKSIYIFLLAFVLAIFPAPANGQNAPISIISYQDSLHGIQVGLLGSMAESKGRGLQFSPVTNMSTSPFSGLQISGISNVSMGINHGMQLSALLNVSSGKMNGLQTAAYNYADSLTGTQVGLINVALSHPKGWQVGLFNITRDTIAHKLGLVNINPNTTIDFMFMGGTASKTNAAMRFRNRSTYSMVGLGTHYMGLDKKFSGAVFYRIGQYFMLSPRWSISGDIGYYHIETFRQNTDDSPQRLFSLQGHLNADYQLGHHVGLYGSVGWGDTRYYHHHQRYRHRPLLELGLTLRRDRATPSSSVSPPSTSPFPFSSPSSSPSSYSFLLPALETTGINLLVHGFDRFVLNADFAQVNLRTIRHNLKNGFVWDNDQFSTNLFAHPYHGNLYFNSARSNGLTFYQAAPYALCGSAMWEFFGEIEPPAINDLMATTMGGIAIGEVAHRISDLILNDRTTGINRFLREAAATVVNPIKGLNRIITGQAWRLAPQELTAAQPSHLRAEGVRVDFSATVGNRYLADNGSLFRGENNPFVNLYLEYGDPLDEAYTTHPYDFFDAEITFGLSRNQPIINSLHLLGRIWSQRLFQGQAMRGEIGIYQHFNYYDSNPVKDGSTLTPYRISEAAAIGPGAIFSLPAVASLTRLEQRLMLSAIILGGTKSDYYNVIDRDYNMGSGFSIKSKTHMEMRNFGRFILNMKYFQLYTWKGYQQQDLATVNPLYLNAQGDKGNARLLVISPLVEADVAHGWSLSLGSTYFFRRTHYRHYADVQAKTFELRGALTYHF